MTALARFPDWPERLAAALEQGRGAAFCWGGHDCCLFACDCIAAMTGVDPARELRGAYTTGTGARRALRRVAPGGLEQGVAALAERHGAPEIPPALARRGDACLLELASGPTLAVCCGSHAAAAGPRGLVMVPMDQARRAWRIG